MTKLVGKHRLQIVRYGGRARNVGFRCRHCRVSFVVVGEYMASITTTPNTVWKTFGAYPGADDLMNCRPKVTSVVFEGEHR